MPVEPECFLSLTTQERWAQIYLALGGESECFSGGTLLEVQRAILGVLGSEECIYSPEDFWRAWAAVLGIECVESVMDAQRQIYGDYGGDEDCFYGLGPDGQLLALFEAVSGGEGPVNITPPEITGTPEPDGILTVSDGVWSGDGITYSYQWKLNGVDVGADQNTYTVPSDVEDGDEIFCVVTATNSGGSASENSNTVLAEVPAINAIYSDDFSGVQGQDGWEYGESNVGDPWSFRTTNHTYDAGVWIGEEAFNTPFMASDYWHPGSGSSAAVRYTVPEATDELVRVIVSIRKGDIAGGDGVILRLWLQGGLVFERYLAFDDSVGWTEEIGVVVNTGEFLVFELNNNVNFNNDLTLIDEISIVSAENVNPTVIYTKWKRIQLSLPNGTASAWPDGNIGAVETSTPGVFRFTAAAGSSTSVTDGTPNAPAGAAFTSASIGSPIEAANYRAGGSVLVDPVTGNHVMIYHGEKWPGGDPARFWSFIGVASSTDEGASYVDRGVILTLNHAYDPASLIPVDIGAGSACIHGGYVYVHFADTVQDHVETRYICLARCLATTFFANVAAGVTPTFFKRSATGWDQPGLGGLGVSLDPGNPQVSWTGLAAHATNGKMYLVMAVDPIPPGVASRAEWMSSEDGITWGPRNEVVPAGEAMEVIYHSWFDPNAGPKQVTNNPFVYYVISDVGNMNRWDDAKVMRRKITLT